MTLLPRDRSNASCLAHGVAALAMCAVLLSAPTVAMAEASRIAVVRHAGEGPLAREARTRLEAELRAAGFEVFEVDARPSPSPRDEVDDPTFGALAALSIVNAGQGAAIDVWVSDRLTQKTLVRRVEVSPSATDAPQVLTVRAVELLRASFIEMDPRTLPADIASFVHDAEAPPAAPSTTAPVPSAPVPAAPVPTPPSPTAPANPTWMNPSVVNSWTPNARSSSSPRAANRASPPPISIGLAVAMLYHFDGEGPNVGPLLGSSLHVTRRWAIVTDLGPYSWGFERSRPGGSVKADEGWAAVGASFDFVHSSVVVASLATALGAYRGWVSGVADAPNHAHSQLTAAFIVVPSTSLSFPLGEGFSLGADLRLVLASHRTDMRINGVSAGGFSNANLGASFGLRYDLPR